MLVLSRRANEAIQIDGGITVTVLHVGKTEVKVGIEAPDGTAILRDDARVREASHERTY